MVAHVVATFHEDAPQVAETTTIPASMVAHVVQVASETQGKYF